MRRVLHHVFPMLAMMALMPAAFSAGVVVGGDAGVSEPVPVGQELQVSAAVEPGANWAQFHVLDSHGNVVFRSTMLPVGEDGTASTVWTPPFADTFTVWVFSYDSSGNLLSQTQVLLVSVYQPDARGFITGGGWIEADGHRRTFGFVAQVQRNGSVRGSLEYQRHGLGMNVKSFAIDWVYAPSLNEGYFSGWATLNGSGLYRFYAMVWDWGEPGRADFFALWVYEQDGTLVFADWSELAGGNIVIHASR
ncbi:MAG: hypothetical protein K6U75_10030 [Firmicutes bacterium]|nr:hypothetical protein [Bacillota bacterium]